MKIIREANTVYSRILTNQNFELSENWRLYRFCETAQLDEGVLVLNLCTNELVLIEEHDFFGSSRLFKMENLCCKTAVYLKEHFFFVPEDHIDARDVDAIRSVVRAAERIRFDGYTHFTVLPTTDCNARCYYCYEHSMEKVTMDTKTAQDTAQFILNNRSHKTDSVRLSWFGGEPLYNSAVIDLICGVLQSAGIEYKSEMVSNGFLFDDIMVTKAVDLWHLDAVQITLDGTETVYNRVKAYRDCGENAYQRVIDNIRKLLNTGIEVIIRLNICENNIDDLNSLVSELDNLKALNKPYVYSRLLFEYQYEDLAAKNTELLNRQKELGERLCTMGLYSKEHDEKSLRIFCCMADDPKSVIIMPNGELRSCEHFPLSAPWGSIYENKNKMTARIADTKGTGTTSPSEYWSEEYCREADCDDCTLYPFCIRLRHCFVEAGHCKRDSATALSESIRRDMLRSAREVL